MDLLLEKLFLETERWTEAIDIGVGKRISKAEMRELCSPETRKMLYYKIATGQYKIAPAHTALIPKDTPGEFRTVYINENIDRIFLSLVNNLLFDMFPDMIHKNCTSYQKGIGCGKVVKRVAKAIKKQKKKKKKEIDGYKSDLSKYFDSVALKWIDEIFDEIERRVGKSVIIAIVREYYHTDWCFDLEGNLVEHYQSLKQGCAVASFLADALLYKMDEALSNLKGTYVRYSDDCLYIGSDYKKAMKIMETMLAEKGLTLNPKKVEYIDGSRYVKFLGFALRGDKITLSKNRIKTFQAEIDKRTIKNRKATYKQALRAVIQYLYGGEYSWATAILPIVNVEEDLDELNNYVMDALRAVQTGKRKMGGLGYVPEGKIGVVARGTGKNVTANRLNTPKELNGYISIRTMRNAYMSSHEAFDALVRTM